MFNFVASHPLINRIHRTRAKMLRSGSRAEALERRIVLSAAPSFSPPILNAVGSGPTWVEAADFNGDGKIDMAISNTGGGTVSIRIGDGTGHFTSRPDLPVVVGVGNMVARDFNGDGILDLAVTKPAQDKISIWLGDGTGHFAAHADFAVGPLPLNIAAGDFNGDGDLDLAVGNTNSFAPGGDSLSVLLGDGSGNFGNRTDVATGPYPIDSVAADLNGDGSLDLIVAHANGDSVGVMLGDGTGQFGPRVDFAVGTQPFDVVAVDFDLDGKLDVATVNVVGGTVSVLLGDGTGGLGPHTEFATGFWPPRLATGDFNGDGNPDLVTPNYNEDTVTFLSGNGTGDFPDRLDLPVDNGPYHVAVADFDNDGKDDLAVLNNTAENVSILLNGLPGNSAPVANDDSFGGPENEQFSGNVLANDTDADGDVLTAALVSGPAHGTLQFNADGSFTYTPAEDFVGVDTFTYNASDGQAVSEVAVVTIVVTTVPSGVSSGLPDPCGPGTVTRVIGTAEEDHILVTPAGSTGSYYVTLNGTSFGPFSDDRIIIRAKGGHDNVQVTGAIARTVSFYGGTGDDRLKGGAGHDVLQGGIGADLLVGGGGRDLLLGGHGADRMVGSAEDDILIAGYSRHDADPAALCRIMREWTDSGISYEDRVRHLRGSLPGGTNASTFLNSTSLFDDADMDVLTGGDGMDWCISDGTNDRVTDLNSGEFSAEDLAFIGG